MLKTQGTCLGIGEKKASYIPAKCSPSPSHYQVKRIYENITKVQRVAKNNG